MRALLSTSTVIIVLSALVSSACTGPGDREASSSGRTTVKVAVVPSVDAASLVLGKEKGFFQQEGIDIETTQAASGPAGAAAVVSGSVDLGLAANVAILQARAKNVPLVAVAPAAGTSADAGKSKDKVVVRESSGITSYAGLSGKTVAVVSVKNAPELYIRDLIDKDGGSSASTRFLEVPFADMTAALENKRVDAVAINEPFLTVLTGKPGTHSLGSYIDDILGKNTSYTYWFTSSSFAAQDPKTVAAIQRAMKKSAEYADSHPDEVRSVLSTFTKTPPDVLEKMALPGFDNPLNAEAFTATAELMRKYGFVEGNIPIDELLVTP